LESAALELRRVALFLNVRLIEVCMLRIICSLGIVFAALATVRGETSLNYSRDIRPILADACFGCHGPDEHKRAGGLRLDRREAATAAAESGATAIVPGTPDASELLARLTSTDPDYRMPPVKSGKKVSPEQIATLRKWIEEGAAYADHWAFVPPRRVPPPHVQHAERVRNPIDAFLLARLEDEGLTFSPEAPRETLLRRLSFDLTGLPPTPAELDAFLADTSPDAYEKQVDRLLASPHYGEQMALGWLDFARYADSNGFQTDSSRQMWPWRDWVIEAFNRNMPFDQFTIEQLAGDMLPEATLSQRVASGFNRNHRINGEGGIIAEEWRIENIMDRVETTSLTWMALTMNCCRCHDHKYDPITQKEFYQFFALFNNVAESGTIVGAANRQGGNSDPIVRVASPEQQAERARREQAWRAAQAAVAKVRPTLAAWQTAKEQQLREPMATQASMWTRFAVERVTGTDEKTKFVRQADDSWLAGGANPDSDTYIATGPAAAGPIAGVLLETFPDPSLPNESVGRYPNGNFVLSGVEVEVTAPSLPQPLLAKIVRVAADYSQPGWAIEAVLDGNPKTGWAVDGPTRREPSKALFAFAQPLVVPEQATLTVRLKHESLGQHNIGRFRLATSTQPGSTLTVTGDSSLPAKVREALAVPAKKRTPQQKKELETFLRTQPDYPLTQLEQAEAEAKKVFDSFDETLPTCMVMRELEKPRETFFLIRGQYDKPGEVVAAGLPAALPPLPAGESMNRLGLARWLVAPEHPLTARVWVNRLWEKLFGVGLVKSSENFGLQSEYPSHLELLDFLALEFQQPTVSVGPAGTSLQPWDMKRMHKLVVLSSAYRQSSVVTPPLWQRDPENRLLARGPRFRLPAETIRDSALQLSGLLVPKLGGPSVRPYMPAGVWDETSVYGDLLRYKADEGEGLYRRTMYTIWKRTAAPPTMLMFDSPSREFCTVKRARTNTPLQALSLLNEVTFVEAARHFGQRMIAAAPTTAERVKFGFRAATSRYPTDEELNILVAGHERRRALFQQQPAAAEKLITFGATPRAAELDPVELAAWTATANVILNCDEVVTKE
jgi:hypothetical protein